MAKKDGMYLYNDWLAPFEKLDRADVGELVIAMMRYFIYGEKPPEFSGLCGMAADFIFPQIDRSMEYSTLGTKAKGVSKTKRPSSHSHIEVADDNNLKKENITVKKDLISDKFDRFWDAYPNKSGKQQTRSCFKKLSPDDSLFETIMAALEKHKSTHRWQKEEGRYVPYPARWLEERRWEDEIRDEDHSQKLIEPAYSGIQRNSSFDTDDFFEAAIRKANPHLYGLSSD